MKDQHGLNLPLGSVKFMYILQQLSWCTVWHTHGTSMGILVLVRSPLLVCPSLHHSYAWPRWISRRPSQSCSGNLNGRSCLKPIWRIVCCTCEDVTNWEFLRNFDHISPLSGWSREQKKQVPKKMSFFAAATLGDKTATLPDQTATLADHPKNMVFATLTSCAYNLRMSCFQFNAF